MHATPSPNVKVKVKRTFGVSERAADATAADAARD